MKFIFPICLLSALLSTTAQAQRPPLATGPSVESGFQLSEPAGFRTSEVFSRLELPLGKAGNYTYKSAVNFSRISVTDTLSAPGELYKSGAEFMAENGGRSFKMGFDSNSDRPFYGLDTINFDFTYTFTVSEKKGHALLGGLNYSSQRSFARNIPFPFIIYRYQSGDFFMIFPFLYHFRLSEKTSLSVTYFPVKNLKASLRYQAGPDFHADLEAGGELDQFLLARRTNKSERFYYQRYTAAVKPSFRLCKDLRLNSALGYFFKGNYYRGTTYADNHERVNIGGAPYFNISLKYIFGTTAPGKSNAPAIPL